jgi:hypothetical protein
MQRSQQLRIAHRQILIGLHPLLALFPSRLRQSHYSRVSLRLKLKPRLGPRSPNHRKLIRSQSRQDQFLLRHKTQNRAPARASPRKVRGPLPTLLQINHRTRRQPSAQPRAGGKRVPHRVERSRNRHLQNQNLLPQPSSSASQDSEQPPRSHPALRQEESLSSEVLRNPA